MLAEYKRLRPNVDIEVTTLTGDINQKILTAAAAKTLPDILFVWGPGDVITWGQMNITTPVDEIVQEYGEKWWLSAKQLGLYKMDNHYWGVPIVTFPDVMWYRADWFKEKGIANPPGNWEEWYNTAKKFVEDTNKDGRTDRWGLVLGIAEGWPLTDFRGSNADYWWDEQGNLTIGPRTVETLDFLAKMFRDTCYPGSVTYQNEGQRVGFIAGQGATMVTSISFINTLIEEKGLEWFTNGTVAIAPVPMNKPFSEGAGADVGTHAIGVIDGPNAKAAKDFLRFWIGKEGLEIYFSNNIPGHLSPYTAAWESEKVKESRKAYWNLYEVGRDIIAQSQWNHPSAKWQALFEADGGGGRFVMSYVTAENIPSSTVVQNLINLANKAKAEIQ
jgi:multiple sugar transport system substrate-binding protein